ncbi:PDZ domain-containing protein [Aliishimia ponticola]|uniref:PDZ domain-containing protein n=1 Tax=Aliishimia ponticola TaxID=2499833 RepID=A0A4S4N5U3_9RHOB|nr:trypsin-like peptidase domain-containing protein [Aliishimia ponticola]THH34472.1 PDZ domain-containing protein [Aliishimia ponticola]
MLRILTISIAVILSAMTATAQERVPTSQAEISLSFAPLVKQAAPAVVNIYAKRVTVERRTPFMNDPFFERFFEGFGQPTPRVQNSLGSGVILTPDGLIVSNYHVVGMATEIRVVLNDRREFDATVLLGDEDSDLAILQLEGAEDLPSLNLRNSDEVEVGELVLAIGNPFGVGQTVSSGIVSGLARSGGVRGSGRGYFIQTDAPINPGNSGGALVDIAGNLIGINTQIVSRSGGSNGIGFAIPANLVAAFVEQARAGQPRFARPWAGMNGQSVDQGIAESIGLDVPEGVVISNLHEDSPFARAGFQVGDVITAVEGVPVNSPAEMVYRMSVSTEDDVLVDYVRGGDRGSVLVTLQPAPDDPPREETELPRETVLPGMKLVRINPAVIAEYNLPLQADGVLVTDPGRLGAQVGLRPGDVISLINGTRVETPAMVRQALTRSGRYRLAVLRGTRRVVLTFRT